MKNYFLLTVTLFFLVSCTPDKTNSSLKIFRYNEHSNISSLDPAFARTQSNIWAVHQLFNGLVQLDDSLHIQPDIAKKWDISPDGLQYTFILRDDVFFHKNQCFSTPDSTRCVTAADFVYSFSRLQSDETASPGKWILQTVDTFQAIGSDTFSIKLKKPFPAFLGLLTTKYASVVPCEAIRYYGNDFRRNPVGTGAFRFQLWEENTKLVFRKNPLYFEKDAQGRSLPYLDAISIDFLPEKQSEFLLFIQGKLDFLNAVDASYKDELISPEGMLQSKYESQFTMLKDNFLNTEYLGIVMDKNIPELQSLSIRKAIAMGVDKEKMIRYLRNRIGTPALNGFIPQGLAGHLNEIFYPYNPAEARRIVRDYQKETGKQPQITLATDANYADICEYIQREMEKIGIACRVEILTPSTLRQSRATGKLGIFRASWIADYPEAENYLSLFYSKNFSPQGANYTHFSDATFNAIYEQALEEINPYQRWLLYQKMDRILMENLPVIPLYYDQSVRFISRRVKGMKTNAINLLQLKSVDIDLNFKK